MTPRLPGKDTLPVPSAMIMVSSRMSQRSTSRFFVLEDGSDLTTETVGSLKEITLSKHLASGVTRHLARPWRKLVCPYMPSCSTESSVHSFLTSSALSTYHRPQPS